MSLYDLLGVPRKARTAEIRRAYRTLAKTVHPDVGGDERTFARLKHAHDILTDRARRNRYDATGEIEEITPDNSRAEAVQMLVFALEQVIGAAIQQGRAPTQIDFLRSMRETINHKHREITQKREAIAAERSALETLTGRFGTIAADGRNLLAEIVAARLGNADRTVDQLCRADGVCNAALAILAEATFRPDQVVRMACATWAISTASSGFSFR